MYSIKKRKRIEVIIIKIVDLDVADVKYALEKNLSQDIKNLQYPQKYLLLEIGNEVESLEISDVTDTAFYLRIFNEEEEIMPKKLGNLTLKKQEIDYICEIISDEMATFYQLNKLSLSEELIAELVEKIIVNALRKNLR